MTRTDVTDVTTTLQERFDHFPGLSPKQAKFAQLIVLYEGRKTATQIAIECGFSEKTARQQASNMQNPKMFPKVVDAINHYRVQFYRKYEVSYDKHLKRMYELSAKAEEAGNWNAAVVAEKNRGQVAGLYIDKKEIKYGTIDSMSMEEVDAKIVELEKRLSGETAKPVVIDGNERQTSQG
tara:strand:+ start:44 stop:583 length:540 start_codon:yes stop_codon:yes gene_type:complete